MATTLKRRGRSPGRPPLGRERHLFNPTVEQHLLDALSEQAATVGMPLATYMGHVLAAAHDYHGQYLQELSVLPSPVTADELHERTDAIGREQCIPVSGNRRPKSFKADVDLAAKIAARCDELDVAYSDYVRAVFREATGHTHTPMPEQLAMVDFPGPRGSSQEVGLRRAG